MAGANPQMLIRIAASIDELKRNLAEGKGAIEVTTAGMQKLAASLDGSKLEQRAHNITAAIAEVGGASKLSDAEARRLLPTLDAWIEKGQRLGKEVPPDILRTRDALKRTNDEAQVMPSKLSAMKGGLTDLAGALGVTFSIGAVVSFGNAILAAGDEIVKMADKTGFGTDEVQKLKYIADQSGVSFDTMVSATQGLQERIGAGDKGLVQAVKHLGLNLDDIKKQTPYDQLVTLATAVGAIKDPVEQSTTAADLFGGKWKEIVPAIKANMQEIGDQAPVMSEATARALDDAGDKLSWFKGQILVWAADSYAYFGKFFDQAVARVYGYIAQMIEAVAGVTAVLAKIPGAATAFPSLGEDIKGLTEKAQWYRDAAKQMVTETENVGKAVGVAKPYVKDLGDANEAAQKKAEQHAKQITAIRDSLTGEGAIRAAKDMMEALEKSAPAYTLTDDAQKRVNETIGKALEAYRTMGKDAPPEMVKVWLETANGVPVIDGVKGSLKDLGSQIDVSIPKIAEIPTALSGIHGIKFGAKIGEEIDIIIPKIPPLTWALDAGAKSFGLLKDAALNGLGGLASAIEGAIAGGGSILASLKEYGMNVAKDFVGGMLSAIPGIGPALSQIAGPVVEGFKKLFGGMFGTAGRDAVKEFAQGLTGSPDINALHTLLQEQLPADAERFWIALTQGVGRNNPEQAQKIITEINTALAESPSAMAAASFKTTEELQKIADKAKAVHEYMVESGKYSAGEIAKAFEASKEAQIAAMGETESAQTESLDAITAKYAESITKLEAEYKSLSESVAAEAEEAEMGVVETQQRARLAQIEAEKKAQEIMRDVEIAAKKESFEATIESARTADEAVRAIFSRPMKIPIEWDYPGAPVGGGAAPIPMAEGGDFLVTRPTLFLAGEAGPERATFSGAHNLAAPSGTGGSRVSTTAMEDRLASIDRRLGDLPRAMAIAAQDAVVLTVRRR